MFNIYLGLSTDIPKNAICAIFSAMLTRRDRRIRGQAKYHKEASTGVQ